MKLVDLNYNGPLGLSWDDTDMEKGLTVRQDSLGDAWLVLGALGDPIRITTPEEVDRLLQMANIEKADKVK
jgi:hypothetical protein